MRPATLRAAIAALALVCATGFIAPQGTVVQTKSSGPLQAVISKKPVGTGTGGRQFYQWYLAVYHLVPGQKPVWEFSSPDMGGPLSEVTQAAGGGNARSGSRLRNRKDRDSPANAPRQYPTRRDRAK